MISDNSCENNRFPLLLYIRPLLGIMRVVSYQCENRYEFQVIDPFLIDPPFNNVRAGGLYIFYMSTNLHLKTVK